MSELPLHELLTERQEKPDPGDLLSGRVPIIQKIGFDDGRIHFRDGTATKTGMILARTGDIVLSGINAAKGAVGIYDGSAGPAVAATIHYGAYIPNSERVDSRYLWRLLRSPAFRARINEFVPGGIKTELKPARLLPIPVLAPELAVQRAQVAAMDSIDAQIDTIQQGNSASIAAREALLASVLRETFTGLARDRTTVGLNDVLDVAGYGTSVKCDPVQTQGAVPVLRIPNVLSEKVVFDDLKYARLADREMGKVRLQLGDLLVVRTNGSADLVGRSAVVPQLGEPTAFASYMIRLRFRPSVVPAYAQWMLRHLRLSGELFDLARTTAGQYNISLGRLYQCAVPIPGVDEQHGIVDALSGIAAGLLRLADCQDRRRRDLELTRTAAASEVFAMQHK